MAARRLDQGVRVARPGRRVSGATNGLDVLWSGLRWLRVPLFFVSVAPLLATPGDPAAPLVAGVALLLALALLGGVLVRLLDRVLPARWALAVGRAGVARALTLGLLALLTLGSLALATASGSGRAARAAVPVVFPPPTVPPTLDTPIIPLAWGANWNGSLGNGTTVVGISPLPVLNLGAVRALAAGGYHSLALLEDGSVWSWGRNSQGQLGDGTTADRSLPAPVPGLPPIVAVAAGGDHSLALTADGTVWAWGRKDRGQLGQPIAPGLTYSPTPQPVPGLTGAIALAAGGIHSVALLGDGTVWAWGGNSSGQLGAGNTSDRSTPQPVVGLAGVTAVAANIVTTLALKGDGTVWGWGSNGNYRLGVGAQYGIRTLPTPLPDLTGVIGIAAGGNHGLAVRGDGTVWAWGTNLFGSVGDGTRDDRPTPVPVPGLGGIAAVSAGLWQSFALTRDGAVWAWGFDELGILGRGTKEGDRDTPGRVPGLHGVRALSTSSIHTLALGRQLPDDALHNCAVSTPWAAHEGQGICATFGTFLHQQADLAVSGRGVGLALVRTYHSADPTDSGFGPGWSFDYGMGVYGEPDGSFVVRMGDGRRDRYTRTTNGTYSPPPGVYHAFSGIADGYRLTTHDQFVYRFDRYGELESIADRNGNTTSLVRTRTTRTVTEPAGRQLVLTYGSGLDYGHVVRAEEVGILGRVVQYSYDQATGDLTSVIDPRSQLITLAYEQHRLKTVTNQQNERVVDNLYDATSKKVITQRDAKDNTTTFDYSQPGRTVVDGPRLDLADTTTYEYDSAFRVVKVLDVLGGATEFARDANHNPLCVTDRFGGRTRREYDARGNVTDFVDARYTDAGCAGTIGTHITYTARNDPETITDPRAYDPANQISTAQLVASFAYTAEGNLRVVLSPYGHSMTYTYNPSGNGDVTSATDHNGFVTTFGYDQWGNLSAIAAPPTEDTAGGSTTTTYQFDAAGRIRVVTDPLNHRTEYAYNLVTAPRFVVTERTFPASGVTLSTEYRYDRIGQLVETTDASGRIAAYDYDRVGNLREAIVAQGTPQQATTSYRYDWANNRTRWTDADGRETNYTYDPLDRPKRIIAPAPVAGEPSLETRYVYDDAQRQVRRHDPNNRMTTTTYDALGQVASIGYPRVTFASGPAIDAFTVAYEYDPAGNRTRTSAQIGTTTYTYDGLNRLLRAVTPQPHWGPGQTATVGYAYDQPSPQLAGARTCSVLTYPQPPHDPRVRTATSCADQAGRLRTVADWHNRTTTYYYDAAGRLRDTVHPNLTNATVEYDDADRLTNVVNARLLAGASAGAIILPVATPGTAASSPATPAASTPRATPGTPQVGTPGLGTPGPGGSPVRPGPPKPTATPSPTAAPSSTPSGTSGAPRSQADDADEPLLAALAGGPFTSHRYTLDPVGNRRYADELTATGGGNGQVEYLYDGQDRLREARFPDAGAGVQTFAYSAAGDQQQWTRGGQTFAFGYDAAGRLTGARGAVYTNDRNGNQTAKTIPGGHGNQTWRYDGANRPERAIGDSFASDPEHRFRYDGDGLLVAEKPWVGAWQSYVYDQTEANPAVLLTVTGDGNDTIFSLYGHGLIARVVTGVQLDDAPKPERYLYYHYDGTGSVRALTTGRTVQPNGAETGTNARLAAGYDYHPYGETRRKLVILENLADDNPLLFAAEPSDKDTGQVYLRARRYDPATGRFTQPDPLSDAWGHPFAYAANNPVTYADHSGYADERAQPVPPSARTGAQGGQVGGQPLAPGRTITGRPAGSTGAQYTGKNAKTGQGLYVLHDENRVVRYVGIGDAPGRLRDHRSNTSPLRNLIGRIIAPNNLTYEEARGLEYQLIRRFGGPQSRNGTVVQLYNKTGGIKPRNYTPQRFQQFLDAGDGLLDEALRIIGR